MLGIKRWTVAQHERALVFRDGSLKRVFTPGVYWLFDPFGRTVVQTYDVALSEFDHPRLDVLVKAARGILEPHLTIVELGDREVGLVYKNGRLVSVLAPGKRQAYWKEPVEVRVDVRDISREFALDASLARVLSRAKGAAVAAKLESAGVAVRSVGVKDVILPGEMKVLLNQVVEAEKSAQANLIKRREETAATRSLLNTARLMDENPTLMRLKELETLEKVTEKIDKLTVFGGLEGVLKDVVRIQLPAG